MPSLKELLIAAIRLRAENWRARAEQHEATYKMAEKSVCCFLKRYSVSGRPNLPNGGNDAQENFG